MREFIAYVLGVLAVFLAPIQGFMFCLFFLIMLDTMTGVIRVIRLREGFKSGKFWAFVPKLLIYFLAAIVFYVIDLHVINSITMKFIEIEFLMSKIFVLFMTAVELTSIKENTEAIFNIKFGAIIKKAWLALIQVKDFYKDIK